MTSDVAGGADYPSAARVRPRWGIGDPSVVVVGAGPVGLTAAWALGRLGVEVTVLEAGDDLSAQSRASTFHPSSLELLADLGLVDDLLARGLVAPTFQYRDRDAGVVAELDLSLLSEQTAYPFRLQLEQNKLCRIIQSRLGEVPVRLEFAQAVTEVRQRGDVVTTRTSAGDEFEADWVIGADGAHSAVRRSLGIGFEGMTYDERFLVVSTAFELRELFDDLALVNYVSDPDEWLVLLRTPEHWRVLFPIPPDETDEHAQSAEAVQARLARLHPLDGGWPVLHTTYYKVHQRVAEQFRVDNVVLAGDAAHINNPLGGMGMNSGLHDAVSAARRIASGPDAVDGYEANRRKVAVEVVDAQTRANFATLGDRDLGARRARLDELAAIAADPDRARAYMWRSALMDSVREHL